MSSLPVNILFVAYHLGDNYGVGGLRMQYWINNIKSINPNFVCDVITASPEKDTEIDKSAIRNFYEVSVHEKSSFAIIKDQGQLWKKDIKNFVNNSLKNERYNFVLLSGGPFMQFGLINFFKRIYSCKIILDFRDPFANNPRFSNDYLKSFIKSIFEYQFVKKSDYILVVNDYCKNLITGNKKFTNKFYIVNNGYNEKVLQQLTSDQHNNKEDKLSIIYVGKLYEDFSIKPLLNVITKQFKKSISFKYIGNNVNVFDKYTSFSNISVVDKMPYLEAMNNIFSSDLCVIFTGGKPFESTTKIFDYIGLEKPILIITEGEIKTGSIHEITKDYPKVFWAKNSEQEITNTLNIILKANLQFKYPDKYKYSRKEGLNKLLKILEL